LSAELDGGGGGGASIDRGWPARPDMGTIEARCSVIVIDQIPWRPIARPAPRALSPLPNPDRVPFDQAPVGRPATGAWRLTE